jgi:SRSO17 transposase
VATDHASLPIAFRLYLPEAWVGDAAQRAKAGIPTDIAFQTKPAIALDQIRAAVAAGLPPGVVLMDAGYGTDTDLREGVTELGLAYVAGIQCSLTVWPPGVAPLPPKPWSGTGRPPKLLRRAPGHEPVSAEALARGLPPEAWRTVTGREGTNAPLASRFAAVRVRPAHRDTERAERRAEEWLLVEWPEDEDEPTKYWLSTLPATLSLESLVETAKLRWRIERDYLDLKQELGLGHYEGRGWRGFHHHATLCIAAYGFLVRDRAAIPPCAPARAGVVKAPDLPKGYRPRGSPAAA